MSIFQLHIQFFISGLELYSFFSMMEGVLEKDNLNCPICDIEVASEQNLENHIQFVHDGKMPVKCPICDEGFASESLLKDHLVSIDCEELNLRDVLDFGNKVATLSADEETEPQKSVILFNSKESEFKEIFQSTNYERKYSTFDERKDTDVNSLELLTKRTSVMQAFDLNAKVTEFHSDDFSKKEEKNPIDNPIHFLVPQNGPFSEMSDNFSPNVKAKEDIVAKLIGISRESQELNKVKIHSRWKCPICYAYKKSEIYLKNHIESQHDGHLEKVKRKHEEYISSKSKRKSMLQIIRSHGIGNSDKKERIWICPTCDSYLKSEIGLKNHIESVHDGRKGPMKGPVTFSNSDSKLGCEELQSKESKKSWMCSFCAMDFDTKSNLRAHVSSEHKQTILQNCPFCDKTFPTSKDLRKHIKSSGPGHRGLKNVKAHKCSFCDETFSTSDDLVLHTSSFHVCLYCAATFAQNNGLKDHIESAHKVKYEYSDSCVQKIVPNVVTFITRNYGRDNN